MRIRRYTDDELLRMSEEKLRKLNEADKIDDDDWMRWYTLRDEIEYMSAQFLHDMKSIAREHPLF